MLRRGEAPREKERDRAKLTPGMGERLLLVENS
jgi:hypothetical protein